MNRINKKPNLIIAGAGRSGTSMVAGCFRNAGYYMGDIPLSRDEFNPKGYGED